MTCAGFALSPRRTRKTTRIVGRGLPGLLRPGTEMELAAGLPGAGDKPPRYIGSWEIVADFSTDVLSRGIRAWIPACPARQMTSDTSLTHTPQFGPICEAFSTYK